MAGKPLQQFFAVPLLVALVLVAGAIVLYYPIPSITGAVVVTDSLASFAFDQDNDGVGILLATPSPTDFSKACPSIGILDGSKCNIAAKTSVGKGKAKDTIVKATGGWAVFDIASTAITASQVTIEGFLTGKGSTEVTGLIYASPPFNVGKCKFTSAKKKTCVFKLKSEKVKQLAIVKTAGDKDVVIAAFKIIPIITKEDKKEGKAKFTCEDSEGVGIQNVSIAGNASVTLDGNKVSVAKDTCASETQVYEYYCKSSTSSSISSKVKNCPAGTTCSEGACVASSQQAAATTCTDSDGGQDLNVKGNASLTLNGVVASSITDACGTGNYAYSYVQEAYCTTSTEGYATTASQSTKCPADKKCVDGACVARTIGCIDSDGGQNVDVKGNATADDVGRLNPTVSVDSCFNSTHVKEAFCTSSTSTFTSSKKIACPSGVCQNGACIAPGSQVTQTPICSSGCASPPVCGPGQILNPSGSQYTLTQNGQQCVCYSQWCIDYATCVDSDNNTGSTQMVAGKVTLYNVIGEPQAFYQDLCVPGQAVVTEYSCSSNGFLNATNITCTGQDISSQNNPTCSNGACKAAYYNPPFCTDSDGGFNLAVKGHLEASQGNTISTRDDQCSSGFNVGGNVIEYSCKFSSTGFVTFPDQSLACPDGMFCMEGACFSTTDAACVDTDGGQDFLVNGSVNVSSHGVFVAFSDFCHNNTYIVERYCDGSTGIKQNFTACSAGQSCSNGACQ